MNNLGGWLLEQIAADEAEARHVQAAYDDEEHFWVPAVVVNASALVSPARVLAECAAKRAIVEHVKEQWDAAYGEPDLFLPREWETVLRLLAQPYADRPGWRQEWVL